MNPEAARQLNMPLWASLLVAAGAGAILDGAFPDQNVWFLAPIGVGLMLVAVLDRGPWAGLLVGFVGGLSFWLTHINWLTLYLGPVPWLALAGLESIFFAVGLSLTAVVLRHGPRLWPTPLGRLGMVPLVVAGLWTGREAISAVWPYGGFSWGRLAMSQSESPLNSLVAWVGMSGLGFLLAWLAALAVQLMREWEVPTRTRALLAAVAVALLLAIPAWPTVPSGTTRLAAVQGASDAGLFAEYTPGEILNDHTQATRPVIGEDIDFIVWPENASDIDPTRFREAAAVADSVSETLDAPLVVGTITERDNTFYNTSLLWEAGKGAVDWYDKVHPVPFAEYVPDRAFWRPFAPELFDLVTRDYAIGTRSNVFDIDGILAGVAICFDIADDQLIHEMVDRRAGIILAQTNNADFGHTDESVQQLAIARLRAIEAGRTVVNISTVGTSAIITPDGATVAQLRTWEPGAMVETVPLSSTVTPAMAAGRGLEWLLSGIGLAGFALCALWAGRRAAQSVGNMGRPRENGNIRQGDRGRGDVRQRGEEPKSA